MPMMDPLEDALDLLNRIGARQWRNTEGEWLISIPRQHARLRVTVAIETLEKECGRNACVLWVKRRE